MQNIRSVEINASYNAWSVNSIRNGRRKRLSENHLDLWRDNRVALRICTWVKIKPRKFVEFEGPMSSKV